MIYIFSKYMRLFLVIEIYDIYYKLICGKSVFLFLVDFVMWFLKLLLELGSIFGFYFNSFIYK